MGYGDYYLELYGDYYRDTFPHSLLRTRQFMKYGPRVDCGLGTLNPQKFRTPLTYLRAREVTLTATLMLVHTNRAIPKSHSEFLNTRPAVSGASCSLGSFMNFLGHWGSKQLGTSSLNP